MKTNETYLHHILDAIERIEQYTEDLGRDEFEERPMVQDAVVRQLEIIGEASRQLSDAVQDRHDDIPWPAIIGMRNRIAHDYMSVDFDIVWDVVQHDLTTLKTRVEAILEKGNL